MSRHHSWIFVINNYSASDVFAVNNLFRTKSVAYAIVGKEIAPTTGTPHLQGYVRFETALSFTLMKKHLCRAKLQPAQGTDLQNQAYSSKENVFIEIGVPSSQGKRNDIQEIANLIKSGDITLMDIMFDYPDMYLRYSRSFEKMFNAVQPHRDTPPQVIWLWGLAGTGKTRQVIDKFNPENVYIKDNTSWWDGYSQQEVILIDDFDNNIPYRTLLRILDRYRYQGQVKGGYVNINSPFIYITCEYPPSHYWSANELDQVTRRLTSVLEIKKSL